MTEQTVSHWYERHPRLSMTLVSLVGIVLVIAAAEIIARCFFPQWAPVTSERATFWQYDTLLGWSLVPNERGVFKHPDFTTQVEINALGLRGHDYPMARNAKKRMLVLGDSFGWGFGVNNNEMFSAILEARHPDWEIINASVSGYGTVQEYLYLQQRGILLKPDVVLLLFDDNDFQDNIGATEYWYNKPIVVKQDDHYAITGVPVPPPTLRQRLDVFFLGNFYIVRSIYIALELPADIISGLLFPTQALEPIDDLDATGHVLGMMMDFDRSHGIRTVVAQLPLSDIKHEAIEAQCQKYSAPCLHLKDTFHIDRKVNGGKAIWHFEHDHHWNQTGHRMAADAIDAYLEKQHLWENPQGLSSNF